MIALFTAVLVSSAVALSHSQGGSSMSGPCAIGLTIMVADGSVLG
jgi:glycerol uptake facilitator-like aquaporin